VIDMKQDEMCEFLLVDPEKCGKLGKLLKMIDYTKCIDCETCERVCSFVHDGKSLVKSRKTKIGIERPVSCFHCSDAPCMKICKKDAIIRGEDGVIYIDYSKCNKCLDCVYACPFRVFKLGIGPEGAPAKCDLCKPLRDEGLMPACLAMCPSKAITVISQKI